MSFFNDISFVYKKVVKFITDDIWRLDFSELGRFKNNLIRHLKIGIITARNSSSLRVGREAVFLSFFGMLATVPFVAVIFAVASSFGLDKELSDLLYNSFPTSTQLINAILGWARNVLNTIHSGTFGWISFLTFVWMIFWLMLCVEDAFNRIWKVEKSRNLIKRFFVYITILFLAPFVLLMFLYGGAYYASFVNSLNHLGVIDFITSKLYWVVFYVGTVIIMATLYKLIPHSKVYFTPCLKASVISGLAFVLIQYLYLETQLMVTRLSTVYGIFAAIPLFMIWMNFCWNIILYGASLSYAFQHVNDYNPEIDGKK